MQPQGPADGMPLRAVFVVGAHHLRHALADQDMVRWRVRCTADPDVPGAVATRVLVVNVLQHQPVDVTDLPFGQLFATFDDIFDV